MTGHRKYRRMSDEELAARIEEAKSAELELVGQVQSINLTRSEIARRRMALIEEKYTRERERSSWRPQEDGFYTVRVTEDTNAFYSVYGDGIYIKDLTTDKNVSWDDFGPGAHFKRFTTEDGLL